MRESQRQRKTGSGTDLYGRFGHYTGLNNKRMFIIEAENDDEQLIVDKLMAVNCTGEHGDGRIFTVDLQSSYSVREGKVMTI